MSAPAGTASPGRNGCAGNSIARASPFGPSNSHAQSALHQSRNVLGIQAIAAVIGLANFVGSVDLMEASSRTGRRASLASISEHARVGDDRLGSSRIALLVSRSGDLQHVAREFENGMLASAAGAEERPILLPRETNHPQRTVHRAIRTRGNAPEAGVRR